MIKTVIDGVAYFDADEYMTYDDAMKWAEENGLRLLQRWEWCKLWDSSGDFRKSCKGKYWWSASVNSGLRYNAWVFNGINGVVNYGGRNVTYSVRCVGR